MGGDQKPRKRTKSNGEGSVYRTVRKKTRVDGTVVETVSWRGYITLDIVGGKQEKKYSKSAPTKAEANKNLRDLINARDAGTLTTTKALTVQEWMEHYLTVLAPKKPIKGRKGNRRSTLATYKGYAKNHVYPRIGKKRMDAVKAEDLEACYQAMADAGMAASSIHQVDAMMKVAFDIAWRRNRMPRNIADLTMLPAGAQPKEDRDVELDEMLRVLEVAKKRRLGAKWVLRIVYGLRQGETLGFTVPALDFDAGVLNVRWQLQRDRPDGHGCGDPVGTERSRLTYAHGCGEPTGTATLRSDADRYKEPPELVRPPKLFPCGKRQAKQCPKVVVGGGVERPAWPCGKAQAARCPNSDGGGLVLLPVKTKASDAPLPMPKQIADLLKARLTAQKRERIEEGPRWKGWEINGEQVLLLFSQRNGRPIDPRDDWDEWVSILEEAGAEHIRPHAARHWAATMMVALEIHPRIAMTLLRHADIQTTMNLYARSPNAELRKAAEEMSALFLGKAIGE